jgi:hypothetical protein
MEKFYGSAQASAKRMQILVETQESLNGPRKNNSYQKIYS